jgi:Tol biopolymer transport system component
MLLVMSALVGLGVWRWAQRPSATTVPNPPAVQRNLTRLTFDEGLQTDPTFSRDGRFIAYASNRSGNFGIWVQPAAGGDAVQVTKSTAQRRSLRGRQMAALSCSARNVTAVASIRLRR